MHLRYSVIQKALYCLLLYFPLTGNTQTNYKKNVKAAPFKTYTVGDKVPDLVFKNLVNHTSQQASLTDYTGKLLLIDFWELTCSSCIAAFPKIQQIQQQFRNEVQVITVTRHGNLQEYAKFRSTFPGLKNFSLPTVLRDDELYKMFPFEFISHVVWIDGHGVVKAITGTDYITPENIELALREGPLPWPVKKDIIGFDYEKPMLVFSDTSEIKAPLTYYSALTGSIPGIDMLQKEIEDSVRKIITINKFNQNLLMLAVGSVTGSTNGSVDPRYLVLDVKDRSRFIRGKHQYYDQWKMKNSYCYSATLPSGISEADKLEFLKKDFARWLDVLGYSAKKERRETACYALVTTRDNKKDITAGNSDEESRYQYPYDSSYVRKTSADNFVLTVNRFIRGFPSLLVNKTGLGADLRMNITFSKNAFDDVASLKKELLQYGFDLVPSACEVELYVITEKDVYKQTP